MKNYEPTSIDDLEKRRKEQGVQFEIELDNEEKDVVWLMGIKRGRRIMWRLLSSSRVFNSSFSTNAIQMAFNEGYRNWGNVSLAMLNRICPELYYKMVQENCNAGNTDDGRGEHTN